MAYTNLPKVKAQCLPQEMHQLALMGMDTFHGPHSAVYYTDGSVDPITGTAGAAFTTQGVTVACRTSNHSSTLQTELVGILGALSHAQDGLERTVVVHTDSKTALQSLQQRRHKDNVQLVTTILGLAQRLLRSGRRVILNWIPSHVGIHGNERADEAARRASSHPVVDYAVRPSLRQVKDVARRTTRALACQAQRQAEGTLRSAAWYAMTSSRSPLNPTLQRCRRDAVHIHRLRLGYRTWAEIDRPQELRECDHCGHLSGHPLL
ncbi:MAG: ribonuclease H family protein, partial [Cyanobacteria bacterium J06553_1]